MRTMGVFGPQLLGDPGVRFLPRAVARGGNASSQTVSNTSGRTLRRHSECLFGMQIIETPLRSAGTQSRIGVGA